MKLKLCVSGVLSVILIVGLLGVGQAGSAYVSSLGPSYVTLTASEGDNISVSGYVGNYDGDLDNDDFCFESRVNYFDPLPGVTIKVFYDNGGLFSENMTVAISGTPVTAAYFYDVPLNANPYRWEAYYDNVLVDEGTLKSDGPEALEVGTPSVYYDSTTGKLSVENVVANWSNEEYPMGPNAREHKYVIYKSDGTKVKEGTLAYDYSAGDNGNWDASDVEVSDLSPGEYYVKCYFESSDGLGCSPPSSFTISGGAEEEAGIPWIVVVPVGFIVVLLIAIFSIKRARRGGGSGW